MSGKRKGAGTSESYDSNKFTSLETAKFYKKTISKASICRERGTDYKGTGLSTVLMSRPWFAGVFQRRQWEKLCKPNEDGCANLLREFYANSLLPASDTRTEPTFRSWVRGYSIDYSPKTIRRFLELPSTEDVLATFGANGPDYHTLLNQFPHEGLFEAIVGRTDADWMRNQKNESKGAIKRTDVKPDVRMWAFYFSDSALPTLSKSELRKELLVFVYCIMNDLAIDLARVISYRIHETANKSGANHCLGYPMLISEIIRARMGQRIPEIEVAMKPNPVLTYDLVEQMRREQRKVLTEPREVEERRPIRRSSAGTSAGAPSSSQMSTELPPLWAVTMQENMMKVGGSMLRRMADLHYDVQTLSEASGHQSLAFRGVSPYSAFEQQMMDLSLAEDQVEQGGGDAAEDDHMT